MFLRSYKGPVRANMGYNHQYLPYHILAATYILLWYRDDLFFHGLQTTPFDQKASSIRTAQAWLSTTFKRIIAWFGLCLLGHALIQVTVGPHLLLYLIFCVLTLVVNPDIKTFGCLPNTIPSKIFIIVQWLSSLLIIWINICTNRVIFSFIRILRLYSHLLLTHEWPSTVARGRIMPLEFELYSGLTQWV